MTKDDDVDYCDICGESEFDKNGNETHDDEYDHDFETTTEEYEEEDGDDEEGITSDDVKAGLDIIDKGLSIAKKYKEFSTPRPPHEPIRYSQDSPTLDKNHQSSTNVGFVQKHPTGVKIGFIGTIIVAISFMMITAIFGDELEEFFNEPEIIIEFTANRGEFDKGTWEWHTNYRTFDRNFNIELYTNIINEGKVDSHNVCIKLLMIPQDPSWINFSNVEYLVGGSNVPTNEKSNTICKPLITSKETVPIKFRFSINPMIYDELVEQEIIPQIGIQIIYDENVDGFKEIFKVIL